MKSVLSKFRRMTRRFGAARDGVAVIEFAFILPPVLYMIMAIFQIGMVFVAGQVLEDATTEFGRLIRTGQAQGGRVDQASFRAAFCDRIAVFMNCDNNNLLIDIQVLPSFGNVSLDWPTDEDGNFTTPGNYQLGANQQTVLMRAFYQYPVWLPFVGTTMANLPNGRRLLSASTAFRNEPFNF